MMTEYNNRSTYETAVLKQLTKDLYRATRRWDMKMLRIPNYQKRERFVERFQGDISRVFREYIGDTKKGLSLETLNSLEKIEKAAVDFIPGYVETRKAELGIKERTKPPSKLKQFFSDAQIKKAYKGCDLDNMMKMANRTGVIGAVLGALVIPGIELYSSLTGDHSLKTFYQIPDTGEVMSAVMMGSLGTVVGYVAGFTADVTLFRPIVRNIRTRKQHKPFYKHMRNLLQV